MTDGLRQDSKTAAERDTAANAGETHAVDREGWVVCRIDGTGKSLVDRALDPALALVDSATGETERKVCLILGGA